MRYQDQRKTSHGENNDDKENFSFYKRFASCRTQIDKYLSVDLCLIDKYIIVS